MKKNLSILVKAFAVTFIFLINVSVFTSTTSSDRPMRIIAGTVSVAEILYQLHAEVIAIPTTGYELPQGYKDLPRIGSPMNPDFEVILSLKPDIYISDDSLENSIKPKLEESGIKFKFVKLSSLDDLKTAILEIGSLVGKENEANQILDDIKKREAKILSKITTKRKPTVMIIFGAPGSFMLATEHSFVGSLVKKLGAKNVVTSPSAYVPINLESLILKQPDYILRFCHASPEAVWKMFEKEFKENKIWQSFEAVKKGNVFDLDSNYFGVSANLRSIEALEILAELLFE
ncbi:MULTISPECIES: heme ABC transporter substrate-binding protein IsdE [Pseudothermotoga]|uniref:High-affinity heme uptake system protein IsdE n=2 Tax=Pseudothermotoga TaxID=1643951 RepID=A8F6M6_PSELT|nr:MULTISPECIES: heme ABC transporter substrate-binding protein IsdE [Pseudothermotoga]ABV33810.1 periplasmic binding protein [Pseudothermotoga lettingae TMO]KUK21376.1 MAG: Periplasmic binding protein [Pseudothermotoga lettingae]MDI3495414.1 heme transport system substrate-binding protein [Pseudothermotoga sp.]MDK2884364.1 heme transport system substrate-binding protein [Pseudothermotoga sp.]GLI49256.1 heme ABC transporter substrate-binding protein IsdE [Pseudothermotoga lettingae TMO]